MKCSKLTFIRVAYRSYRKRFAYHEEGYQRDIATPQGGEFICFGEESWDSPGENFELKVK